MNNTKKGCRQALLWLIGSCLAIQISCSSSDVDPLPVESQSGQNILACRIDGDVWFPHHTFKWDFMNPGLGQIARYSKKSKTLYVGGSNDENGHRIEFSLLNCTGEGVYLLTNQCDDLLRPTASCGAYSPDFYISSTTYWTNAQYTGEVVITKLTSEIVSGRFSFTAVNQKTARSMQITEGRFGFQYAPGVDD